MYVIADNSISSPAYLVKVVNGIAAVSYSLADAKVWKIRKEAVDFLKKEVQKSSFNLKVLQLGIVS